MSTLFHFRFEATERVSALALFCAQTDIPEQDLWEAIQDDVSINLRPDAVYIIVRKDCFAAIAAKIEGLLEQESQWRIDPKVMPMGILAFDAQGRLARSQSLNDVGDIDLSEALFTRLKETGLRTIFKVRNGLLRATQSVHYIHPSGRHSRGFMRAANALIHGPEVSFIATCLLNHLDRCKHYLWVDTSSIAGIGYAMVALRQAMQRRYQAPVISSFSSYAGLETTKFERTSSSLVLISASTSGNLARQMISEKYFAPENVVILFSLAKKTEGLSILCDLAHDERINPAGAFSAIDEFDPAACPMCQEGSKAVRFVGDQFLADAIVYEPYTIVAKDAPASLAALMKTYAGKGIFQIKAAHADDDHANEIWVDVARIASSEVYRERIRQLADRYVPLSASHVVYLDDPSCQATADIIGAHLAPISGSRLKTVGAKDLGCVSGEKTTGSVVVVASCIGSGASLQSVSLDLREPFGDRPRIFIVPFAKHSHTDRFRTLRSDLDFNGASSKHEVAVLHSLTLPVLPKFSSWSREAALLKDWLDVGQRRELAVSPEVEKLILQRLDALSSLASGSSKDLFWPAPDGHVLRIRQTFAFWPGINYKPKEVEHGDIFATIASVLENLRAGPTPKLRHSSYYHTLISPACFGRFNDGIIQASLLRGALPQELNYSASPALSGDMANIIGNTLNNFGHPRGEAALEFLIALGIKRVTLAPEHLKDLLKPQAGAPAVSNELVNFCRHILMPSAQSRT